ncbi:MAG TPA: hypothetical protein VGD52_00850 [Pseudoduganella sp.]
MEAEPVDHEVRIRELEQKVPDLACELKLLGAELRAEITAAITQSEARMRVYVDARLTELEQRLTARIVALEQDQRWIIGLLVAILLGMAGLASGMATLLSRLA